MNVRVLVYVAERLPYILHRRAVKQAGKGVHNPDDPAVGNGGDTIKKLPRKRIGPGNEPRRDPAGKSPVVSLVQPGREKALGQGLGVHIGEFGNGNAMGKDFFKPRVLFRKRVVTCLVGKRGLYDARKQFRFFRRGLRKLFRVGNGRAGIFCKPVYQFEKSGKPRVVRRYAAFGFAGHRCRGR